MNTKLIEFFKKAWVFIKKNWIPIAIIVGLLLMSGTCSKIASDKIAKLDKKIEELTAANKILDQQIKDREKEYIEINKKIKEFEDDIKDLEKKKAAIAAAKAKRDKEYAALLKKFGDLSLDEQDKLLVDLLKKYDIAAEVRDNLLVITMTDRGKLYTFIIDIDKVKSDLKSSQDTLVICEATVKDKDGIIEKKNSTIVLKNKDIKDLESKVINLEEMVKTQKSKLFWTKVGVFGKRAIPAMIVGLVLGFLAGK